MLRNNRIKELEESIDVHYVGYMEDDILYNFGNLLYRFSDKYLQIYIISENFLELSFQTLLSDITEFTSAGIFTTKSNYIYV